MIAQNIFFGHKKSSEDIGGLCIGNKPVQQAIVVSTFLIFEEGSTALTERGERPKGIEPLTTHLQSECSATELWTRFKLLGDYTKMNLYCQGFCVSHKSLYFDII